MKKYLYLCLISCSLLGPLEAKGQSDADIWSNSPQAFKIGFLMGWNAAGHRASIGIISSIQDVTRGIEREKDFVLNKMYDFQKESGFGMGKYSYEEQIRFIDNLYLDHRLKSSALTEIMPLLRGRLVDGWSAQDLEDVVDYRSKSHTIMEECRSLPVKEGVKCLDQLGLLKKPSVLKY